MGDKVVLPKEVADAIERLRDIGITPFGIANRLDRRSPLGETGLAEYLKVVSDWKNENGWDRANVIMSALVNGYTIEKSPEEKVREYYNELINRSTRSLALHDNELSRVQEFGAIAVKCTLNLLGITIEGVNDNV